MTHRGGRAVFTHSVPRVQPAQRPGAAQQCSLEFAGTFYSLFMELWNVIRFPVPAQEEIDPKLRAQLGRLRANLRTDEPDGALLVFLRC
jgi:hypothetical protein